VHCTLDSYCHVRQAPAACPSPSVCKGWTYGIPWFKHYRPQVIEEHTGTFRKVAENADELLAEYGSEGGEVKGGAGLFNRR
jgi:hypothetical protein